MLMDDLIKIFKRNDVDFDIFKNIDSDDCKDKYNNLIYFFSVYIMNLKSKKLDRREMKAYDDILNYNKDALLMYLNLCLDILDNQVVDNSALEKEDFSGITDLNGNFDLTTLDGKKIVLKQIRNAFAHKSGKIFFFEDSGVKKVRIDNKKWFSIQCNISDINRIFKNIVLVNNENNLQKLLLETINCVEKGNYQMISEDAAILVLLNLLMCYNKESIFDRFMLTQTSFIDASKFEIESTEYWSCSESRMRQLFFDVFNIHFHSNKDKELYEKEWKSIVDIDCNSIVHSINYTYNTSNMPYDIFSNRHIPIPIFMNILRNANCHGRIIMQGDYFIFYDQEKRKNSNPNLYMKINKNDLLNFIFSDYFTESLFTTIDDHQNEYSMGLYLLEQAESANNLASYIDTYICRLPNLTEFEVIRYMYDNNKFSSYLIEYPGQTEHFLNYKLKDGTKLITLLASFEERSENEFNYLNINGKKNNLLKNKWMKIGLNFYYEYITDFIEVLKGRKKYKSYYEFFNLYYAFLRNLKTINSNIKFTKIDELSEEEKQIIQSGSEELRDEFIDNDVLLGKSNYRSQLLLEVGMQQSQESELDKIIFVCSLNKKNVKQDDTEPKEKRHTIKNIEKHSTLSHVYVDSSKANLKISSEDKIRILKIFAVNLGIRLFNAAWMSVNAKEGLIPPELGIAIYSTSVLICNFAIFKTWSNLVNKLKEIRKYEEIINDYSEQVEGEYGDENRINGSNNIRR